MSDEDEMPDEKTMPADGGGVRKGEPDGVSGTPGSGEEGRVHGRVGGGESGGGAYPNPHGPEVSGDKPSDNSGLLGHAGQSEKSYYGGSNPNATTGGGALDDAQDGGRVDPSPERTSHEVEADGQHIDVIEDSGVAAAEATGKVGTDAPYEREQESPGGG